MVFTQNHGIRYFELREESLCRGVTDAPTARAPTCATRPTRSGDGRAARWTEHRAARREELIDAAIAAINEFGSDVGHGPDRRGRAHQQAGDLPLLRRQGRPVPRRRPAGRRQIVVTAAAASAATPTRRRCCRPASTPTCSCSRTTRSCSASSPSTAVQRGPGRRAGRRPSSAARSPRCSPPRSASSCAASASTRPAAQPWGEAVVGFIRAASLWWLDHPQAMTRQQLTDYLAALLWGGGGRASTSPAGRDVDARPRAGRLPAAAHLTARPGRTTADELDSEPRAAGRRRSSVRCSTGAGPRSANGRASWPTTRASPSSSARTPRRSARGCSSGCARWPRPATRGSASRPRYGGGNDVGGSITGFEMLAMGDLSLLVKAGRAVGPVRRRDPAPGHRAPPRGLPAPTSSSAELLGCFAMTETGHGSDVASLRTTATYDPDTDEFVIHTPDDSARKEYIGNAARDGRVAVVFAQLITGGETQGVHAFLVPIRDARGHAAAAASASRTAASRPGSTASTTAGCTSTTSASRATTCSTATATSTRTARTRRRSRTRRSASSPCSARWSRAGSAWPAARAAPPRSR